MRDSPTFEFDRQLRFTDLGTSILSRFLMGRPHARRIENVEADPRFQRRDIDLIGYRALRGFERTAVEIKCDAHFGADEAMIRSAEYPYCAARTDNFAVETVSNDRTGSHGWIFGSQADMLLYYFAAIPRTLAELEAMWAVGEEFTLARLGIEADRLYVIDLNELRGWFEGVQNAYHEVAAQNQGYPTLSCLVPCRDVVNAIRHCHVIDGVYRVVAGVG